MRLIDADAAIEALNTQAEEMSHWSERYQEQRRGVLTAVNIVADCPSAQPEQRWIPVTEILPENDDKVLITHSHGVSMAWWNGRYWTGSMIRKYKTVTAWLPLPERYSGK